MEKGQTRHHTHKIQVKRKKAVYLGGFRFYLLLCFFACRRFVFRLKKEMNKKRSPNETDKIEHAQTGTIQIPELSQ